VSVEQNLAVEIVNPDVPQREASDPNASVWVAASAGSGKTKVLTDRVLRLLLPRSSEVAGSDPSKILCLTFTKAAASEMTLRISSRLADWAVADDTVLGGDLGQLLGREVSAHELVAARRLFAQTVDVPGGLKIMTVHAFCQSVLSRFPLEAGIHPNFNALEEREAGQLLSQAARDIMAAGHESFRAVAEVVNEDQFLSLLQNFASERYQFRRILADGFGIDGVYTALCGMLGIVPNLEREEIIRFWCNDTQFDVSGIQYAASKLLNSSTKTDKARGDQILRWLALDIHKRVSCFDTYKSSFFTTKNEIYKNIATKSLQKSYPEIEEILKVEAVRLYDLSDRLNATECADYTRHLMGLIEAVLERYDGLKVSRNALDFDDLILKSLELMRTSPSWVMYKLDNGLEHILIDEAQDTNPEQWQIIDALCSEFYAGDGAQEVQHPRTIFTVGDEKQSIYSFQRASPQEFERMRGDFREKIKQAEQEWRDVAMNVSFRSTPAVLGAVDAVFADEEMRAGLGDAPVVHQSFRPEQAGLVEVWPLCEADEEAVRDPWEPPTQVKSYQSGMAKLCEQIADRIEGWLSKGEILPSHDRAIEAGDIMILVRSRGVFVRSLAQALKARDIPVGGADRLVLNNEIAVQDLLALMEFCLCPADDLTLASVLKSPLIGMSEDELFAAAHGREGTLWAALVDGEIRAYLQGLMGVVAVMRPYDFLCYVLQNSCPADEVSGTAAFQRRLGVDVMDVLSELQNAAFAYERDNVASLQGFVHWQRLENRQIKREMEGAADHVRIMTVHGAKGLQAPIVILPDTVRTVRNPSARADSRMLWPDRSGLAYPLWAPWADVECRAFKDGKAVIEARAEEEYRRLLYVAMTRAEDRLYVCGAAGKKTPLSESWYFYVQRALGDSGRMENAQNGAPDRVRDAQSGERDVVDLPGYVFEQARPERDVATVVNPSRLEGDEKFAFVPSEKKGGFNRFRRGNVAHKLLQILPDIAADERRATAERYMGRFAADLPMEVVDEVMGVLEDPIFAPLFGVGSMAEVSVTGRLGDGSMMSGQIDRLLVTDDVIFIIDYKTHRSPPEDLEQVPDIYVRQVQAYADALRGIYPGRIVRAALLWTDGAQVTEVEV